MSEVQAAPSSPPPAPVADAGHAATLHLRRLTDRAVAAEIALRLRDARGVEHAVVTDAGGRALLPATATMPFARLRADTPGIMLARGALESANSGRTLWCYETIRVRARVVFEAPPSEAGLTSARGTWRINGRPPGVAATGRPEDDAGVQTIGVTGRSGERHERGESVDLTPDRDFEVEVPRATAVFVVLEMQGMTVASCAIDPSGAASQEVELVVAERPSVTGRILGPEGAPIFGARVQAYVERHGPPDARLTPEDMLRGVGTGIIRTRAGSVVIQHAGASTDADGRFTVLLPFRARPRVVAFVEGFRVSDRVLDDVSGEAEDVVLIRDDGPTLRLQWKGAPIARGKWYAGDIEGDGVQPCGRPLPIPALGEIPTGWLQMGHRYWLRIRDSGLDGQLPVGGVFRWQGQASVDVEKLTNDPDSVR